MQSSFDTMKRYALPFESDDDLLPLLEAIGDAKIVCLGEASHGTSEFYTVRARLSKMLIEQKGFTSIAVEGDWPSAQKVNRYIKDYTTSDKIVGQALQAFHRWPTWMWANEEISNLINWLKKFNQNKTAIQKVGFYGIDLYSLWESIDEIIRYLTDTNPAGADLELAKKAFSCFEPYNRYPEQYAISTVHFSQDCIDEVSQLLASIRSHPQYYKDTEESDLNIKMNALVAKNAESYYRAMMQDNAASWNIRDEHMVEAINEIRAHHGLDTKMIVWEHNTHIGDARATAMKAEGMLNIGQILREQYHPDQIYTVGFGTHRGTVIAAEKWGLPHKIVNVPPAKQDSWEDLLHRMGSQDKLFLFTEENRKYFQDWIGHRAIGVVYNPEFEMYGNYVPSQIGNRYDAFIYIDRTKALQPINVGAPIVNV
ncbi:erythromycin esterase family protein [Sporosarcina sp. HYO08]|uniref:erythromycin esterase family protein n=1 Tax=Sporosarcina sp. HYO08 TaxID=1759557 RepID=UPI0007973756|nr:erythromycin esterase family protein [Sporosarcina sp. HYO08]KXH87116.1 protein-L-isoaspartate O-methyltransferase [Sporosarcina sp. HYO08]